MENDYIPHPNRYFATAFLGSVILVIMSSGMGETAAYDQAVWSFFWFAYAVSLIGYVAEMGRVWLDGHTHVYKAQVEMGEMLDGLDEEGRNALAKIDLTITLERHRREWVQKFEGIPIEYWLYFWDGCEPDQVRPERSCPEGDYRTARNAIVKWLIIRKWCAPLPIGNKSELWINNGYEIFKSIIESYKYTFEPVQELKGE